MTLLASPLINPPPSPRKPNASPELIAADKRVVGRAKVGLISLNLPGMTDPISTLGISGWAFDGVDHSRTIECSLVIDNRHVRNFVANRPNEEGGAGNHLGLGHHAFSVPLPFDFLDGATHFATVLLRDSGLPINSTPIRFSSESFKPSGHINGVKDLTLRGWACFRSRPEFPVELTVLINHKFRFNVWANQFREDLEKARIGNGHCSFTFAVPPATLNADVKNTIAVTYRHSGGVVPDGKIEFIPSRSQITKARENWPKPDVVPTVRPDPISRLYPFFDNDRAFAFFSELKSQIGTSSDAPKISIIMPCWNRGSVLHFSVQSVLQQAYRNWELIIVDDGSTDNTAEAVQPFLNDNRISYLRIPHAGVSAARNAGLRHSKGRFIAYLDSDNLWTPYYLDHMVRFMLQHNLGCAYSGLKVCGDDGVNYRGVDFDWNALLEKNYVDLNIFMHDRSLYEELGGFDTNLRRMVDWDLILRYTKRAGARYAPFIGAEYDNYSREDRITVSQAGAYAFRVIEKQLIDWKQEETKPRLKGRASIIVPCLENLTLTEQCLRSIFLCTSGDFEVILIDNGSGNVVKQRLASVCHDLSKVRMVSLAYNLNFAIGCNLGAVVSSGEYLVFLNNDTVVTDGWLEALLEKLKSDEVRGTQALLLYEDATVQCAGHYFNKYNCLPYHLFQNFPFDHSAVSKTRQVRSVTGACMAVRASEFISLRGFDTLFVNGGEDVDLCLRMSDTYGGHFLVVPDSIVYHLESKTPGRGRHIVDNRTLLRQRYMGKVTSDDEMALHSEGLSILTYSADRGSTNPISLFEAKTVRKNYLVATTGRILVVKPSGIGNMLLFVPAMLALRQTFPNAKFTVVCYSAEAAVIRHLADSVIELKKNPEDGSPYLSELDTHIAKEDYDLAIYPPFTNIGQPTALMKRSIRWHITHPFRDFERRHELDHNMDLARMLGYFGPSPEVELPTAVVPDLDRVPRPYIAVHVGASATPHMQKKKWPLSRWAEVVTALSPSFFAVFVGGPGEEEDVKKTLSYLPSAVRDRCTSFCGVLDLTGTATVLQGAAAVLANDSGLMHLAASMDRPVIAVFGPTSPEKNAPVPLTAPARVVRVKVPCGPCFSDREKLLACANQICLSSVTPDMVTSEFKSAMAIGHGSDENA